MLRLTRGIIPAGLLVLLVNLAPGSPPQTPPLVPPTVAQGWEEAAREHELAEPQIKFLREQKFLVTDHALRQVFVPYNVHSVPLFITSDSVLNAYHVLFEESLYRMEMALSRQLPGVLGRIAKNLDAATASFQGDEALTQAAKRRAAIFLGVAQNVLDDNLLPADPDVRAVVRDEVKRVVAASGAQKPAWLGRPDEGFLALDYTRFNPRGFYTRTPGLRRYFRATAWLQAVPFRLDRDEEFAALLLMRRAWDRDRKSDPEGSDLWGAFRTFLGDRDDLDLPQASVLPEQMTKAGLGTARERYTWEAMRGRSPINDQLRFAPTEAGVKPELAFRFLSAYRLPDAVMFARTMSAPELKRDFPSGLEVAAALGSPLARDRLRKDSPKLLDATDANRPLFKGSNLYAGYLRCLGTLLERTEPDAPEFLRGQAWRIKTTQTALASWAQMRHTWTLQAKVGAEYVGAYEGHRVSGFVEPVPEFYGRLAQLVDDTADALRAAGAMKDEPKDLLAELAQDVRAAQALVNRAIEKRARLDSFSPEERNLLARFDLQLEGQWEKPRKEEEAVKVLKDLQSMLWYYEEAAKGNQRFAAMLGLSLGTVAPNWEALSKLCHRLEVLAHKQLRQVPFSQDEDKFILGYGEKLAKIMFYRGNSYITPKDDAVRVADVYTNAARHLHVGIARPRVMLVLYPTKRGEVLCRGAIVPYAEFTTAGRLTDDEWKSLLDSPRKPDLPAWARLVIPPERPRDR
jgi:hypothetical protein